MPIIWLLLAPTKTDYNLVAKMPFDFGSLAQMAKTWDRLYSFESGVVLVWLRNSAIYSFSGTGLAVLVGIPAGYALAVTKFAGRKFLLTLTLIVMLVPANALVLPLFLEMHDVHLLGKPLSAILPFAFFPSGSTWRTSTSVPPFPATSSPPPAWMAARSGTHFGMWPCPWRYR